MSDMRKSGPMTDALDMGAPCLLWTGFGVFFLATADSFFPSPESNARSLAPLGVCGHTDGRGKEEARGERGTESDATSGPDRVSESEDAAALRAPGHEMKRLYMYEHYILRCKMSTRLGAISPAPYESGGRGGITQSSLHSFLSDG